MIPLPVRKFSKKPDEVLPRFMNYANKLPDGCAIDTVEITAKDSLDNDITDDVIHETIEIIEDKNQVKFYVMGGIEGLRASIKVVVTLDDDPATVLVDYLTMLVRENS